MSGGLIVVNGQRFCAAGIGNWRVEEHTMPLAREDAVNFIWGLKFRTRLRVETAIVRTVVVEYHGKNFVYHDSPELLKNIGLLLGIKEADLTPELREAWQDSRDTITWHYVLNLDGLILELQEKTLASQS